MRKNRAALKWESAQLNMDTYYNYLHRILLLAVNSYEWKGLPETIDQRFLEYTLITNGVAVFFEDEVAGYLALQTMYGGDFDVYRIPNDRRAYAVNGYNRQLDGNNSILIFNNFLRTHDMLTIELFARRLYELERTIDVNVKAQKTPVVIQCSEEQRLVLKNLYMQYDGNEPFIFGNKDLGLGDITSINTNAPYVSDKLFTLKSMIWKEILTFFGIATANTDKRERLNMEEVSSNLGDAEMNRFAHLNARRQAADKINRMFGLSISVDFRSEMPTGEDAVKEIEEDPLEVNPDE